MIFVIIVVVAILIILLPLWIKKGRNIKKPSVKQQQFEKFRHERESVPEDARSFFERVRKMEIVDQIYNEFKGHISDTYFIQNSCVHRHGGYRTVSNPLYGAYPYDEYGNARDVSSKTVKEQETASYYYYKYGYDNLNSLDQIDGFAYAIAERLWKYCLSGDYSKTELRLEDILDKFEFTYALIHHNYSEESKDSYDASNYEVIIQLKKENIESYYSKLDNQLLQWN